MCPFHLLKCVILTDAPLELQLKVNQFCRAQDPAIKVLLHRCMVIQPFAVHVYLCTISEMNTNHINSVKMHVSYADSACQYEVIVP